MIRIVKMTLLPEKVDTFIQVFVQAQQQIQSFEGCRYTKLVKDKHDETTYFTISEWEDEIYLNRYRDSDFFAQVWKAAKTTFSDKAIAWSVDDVWV
jgi:heme-degrading monooxygenase HmoA